jgi:hypothetical protein
MNSIALPPRIHLARRLFFRTARRFFLSRLESPERYSRPRAGVKAGIFPVSKSTN